MCLSRLGSYSCEGDCLFWAMGMVAGIVEPRTTLVCDSWVAVPELGEGRGWVTTTPIA